MTPLYTKKKLTQRILLFLSIPLLLGGLIYTLQRPVDTRTRDGVSITIEEPLGNWKLDEEMVKDYPSLKNTLLPQASGDEVYQARIDFFHTWILKKTAIIALLTLVGILLYDGVRAYEKRKGSIK